jgi:hypothetical protein
MMSERHHDDGEGGDDAFVFDASDRVFDFGLALCLFARLACLAVFIIWVSVGRLI